MSGEVVTSVEVLEGPPGGHDRVRVWNRHGLAGELVVRAGDGAYIADRLMVDPHDAFRERKLERLEALRRRWSWP